MSTEREWQTIVRDLRATGHMVIPLDRPDATSEINKVAPIELARALSLFVDTWADTSQKPWQAWSATVLALRQDLSDNDVVTEVAEPLRRLVDTAVHAAIVVLNTGTALSRYTCFCALQLRQRNPDEATASLRLHLPAEPSAITSAEQTLGTALPPSYIQFLNLTNGLGLDASESTSIAGVGFDTAGASRLAADLYAADIVGCWRNFQQIYAFERQRDIAEGTNTFGLDERSLVSFMITLFGDEWCFDTSKLGASGDCPVVFWDHEQRASQDAFANFADWLNQNLDKEIYGEE